MADEERSSNVPWPRIVVKGGDLDDKAQTALRQLLDDFGLVLEEEATSASIRRFVFPIFRQFSMIAALTASEALFAVAPSSGMPTHKWLDWRVKSPAPAGPDLAAAVREELGWDPVTVLSLPASLLNQDLKTRAPRLRVTAKEWVAQVMEQAERQRRIVRLTPVFRGRDFLVEDDLCFVLMPLREPFFRLYDDHVKPTLMGLDLRVMKADDLFTPTAIMEDIWEYINRSRLIIADVTGRNPNVFYELGIAHTVGKDVIILTQNEDDVPFDLRHLRYFVYSDNDKGWRLLRRNLTNAAAAAASS